MLNPDEDRAYIHLEEPMNGRVIYLYDLEKWIIREQKINQQITEFAAGEF